MYEQILLSIFLHSGLRYKLDKFPCALMVQKYNSSSNSKLFDALSRWLKF